MAELDFSLYLIGLLLIPISVYIFPFVGLNIHFQNAFIHRTHWFREEEPGKTRPFDGLITSPRKSAPANGSTTIRNYSLAWLIDEKSFQLERRAIFSKTWLYVTHASRFQKPGDYRTFEIAGFSFIIILGKDRQIRAFHNVCRHRAYAVTKKESGSSTVLGCRYHGWSYDTKGKLIKAPEFESVAGFDKSMNGLWEIKTEVRESMVFVNFDAGNEVKDLYLGQSEKVLKRWNITKMKCVAEWKIEGAFNWKLGAEAISFDPPKMESSSWWPSFFSSWSTHRSDLKIMDTTRVSQLNSGKLLLFRLLPDGANATIIECSVYATSSVDSTVAEIELAGLKKATTLESSQLEIKQRGVSKDTVFANPSKVHDKLDAVLKSHARAETEKGRKVYPAARSQNFTEEGMEDDEFCRELEISVNRGDSVCGANSKGLLDW